MMAPMVARLIVACGLVSVGLLLSGPRARGQNLLPNPGLESGADAPSGWRLTDGRGKWEKRSDADGPALAVEGNGNDQSVWRTDPLTLEPGGLYRFTFRGRRQRGGGGGSAISGTGRVNRDFRLGEAWETKSFVFTEPEDSRGDYARLGQWHAQGRTVFASASLVPVLIRHAALPSGGALGEGESVRDGVYRFSPNFGWPGANAHRPLYRNRAGFNSDRWLFPAGAEVVYRLGVDDVLQRSAQVRVAINYYTDGVLRLEAGRDGDHWQVVTNFDGARRGGVVALPKALFPSSQVFVRLVHEGAGGGFQVNTFEYEAALEGKVPDHEGATQFLDVLQHSPDLEVAWEGIERRDEDGQWQLGLVVTNRARTARNLRGSAWLEATAQAVTPSAEALQLAAGASGRLRLSCPVGEVGTQRLQLSLQDVDGSTLFAGRIEERLGFLDDPRPGYWLASSDKLAVWWCESGWKIGRERGLPARPADGRPEPITVSAARGEWEPVQVIVRPMEDGELLHVAVEPWGPDQEIAADIEVRLNEVAYVSVTKPTDASCLRGDYPDPLPPLRNPLALRAGRNQSLWLTVEVGRMTPPGDYRTGLELKTSFGEIRVPLSLHVYDFALPEETHLKSALGLGTHAINQYHKLARREDQEAVFAKYLRNFAEHRISPYSFYDYAPIDIRFVGEGAEKKAQVDFTRFDEAARTWLDGFHFNTFKLPLRGMGGGTFHSRHLGRLEGFEEGTPEHARLFQDYLSQVERHLRERGWLDKAFTYWFDEPDPKDYAFVVEGMKRIRAAAPGVRRMLTEQPEPELMGNVDIWCGLTPEWTPEKVQARNAAGEEVWWYICTGPKAPYVTEFIDHPGTELRLWPWQSWQYGVSGILIWATIYWTSPAAFPSPRVQNPWEDPMSYVSGYDYGAGHVGYWGNGDGRFLYPPRRDPEKSREPNFDEPINSVRWENLRDGMEDYEYFWLLQKAIERVRAKGGAEDLVREAEALLKVPAEVSLDLTHFTTDPRPMLRHRDRVAGMIETLGMR